MKKLLLNNLSILGVAFFLSGFVQTLHAEKYFLIFKEDVKVPETVSSWRTLGWKIHQIIPPRIAIVEGENYLVLPADKLIQKTYTSIISIEDLSSFGPLAISAGLKWNQSLVKNAQKTSPGQFGAMSSLAAKESLLAPKNVSIQFTESALTVGWESVFGAAFYEVEMAKNSLFDNPILKTFTDKTTLRLPALSSEKYYVRVRARDRINQESLEDDLKGEWAPGGSATSPLTPSSQLTGTTPVLISPLSNFESVGTSIILEWQSVESGFRVQMATENNFENVLIDTFVDSTDFSLPSSVLSIGRTYFWRVKLTGQKESGWSTSRKFTVNEPQHHYNDVFINPEAPK